jgi:tyrosine-protein phosphatase SIW14
LADCQIPSFRFVSPIIRVVAATLAFVLTLSVSASQTETPEKTDPHSAGTRLKGKGIPNFGQVSANLYRGGQPSADGLTTLKNLGVEVVIDLRGSASDTEQSAVTKLRMRYISIPSHCPFPTDKPWAHFLKVMRENHDKKVFVHCRLGDDRTGLAVATYRMSEEGWSPAEALKEMRAFGFNSMHHAICPGLQGYVERFPERLKSSPAFRDLSPQKTDSRN